MVNTRKILFNVVLGTIVCLGLIFTSTPQFKIPAAAVASQATDAQLFAPTPVVQATTSDLESTQRLITDVQEAEATLLAQGAGRSPIVRYAAILLKTNVVPTTPTTMATGVAGAALAGDRLVIRGDFGNLSSGLRDYATDPVSPPNPNITSAVHVHRGAPRENGPFQYALTVTLDSTGLGGRFAGEYTLTSEQLQALSNGMLYVDIHTKQNRVGELRGIFQLLQ